MRTLHASALILALASAAPAQTDVADVFQNPPEQAKPHTWWHWMNGNITREGITADLEAMKKIGLGGAQIFNVSEAIPDGPAPFMSPRWRELFAFAVQEADRVGIELCIHNCSGWSSSGGPWIKPEQAMHKLTSREISVKGPAAFSQALPALEANQGYAYDIAVLAFPTPKNRDASRIKDLSPKAGFEYRYAQDPALDSVPADACTKRHTIVDLTTSFVNGKLNWDVPDGEWSIVRFGATLTGAQNAPSPVAGRGLECDKLSRDGIDAHWAGAMAPILKDIGPLAGKTLNNCLVDSYEMGGQNWTPKFREEFVKRRGYDPLPFLPIFANCVVDSGEVSERFLWDFRRTIADLFADNYYTRFAELCHENKLVASIEPYDGPFECLLVGRPADIPMGEFWVGGGESISCKLAASVAHTYGRTIVGAEAFTADPNTGRWQNHPYSLKAVGDLMYTVGINRCIVHRYAHQPWKDVVPGMTMGQWGTHFERTTTWWEQGGAWVQYLTRCQAMLQHGLFCADVLYYTGESAPIGAPHNPALKNMGYDYDACNFDVLMNRISVKDGRLVLPDGVSYRVLALPDSQFMRPRVAARIRDLIAQGATVIGPRPTKSPSLNAYPGCDTALEVFTSEIWGKDTKEPAGERTLEKGRVIWGTPVEQVLADAGVAPDCEFAGGAGPRGKMAWIHRKDGGGADVDFYFVSNQKPRSQNVNCTFRVTGRAPELWHPDTGRMEQAPVWSDDGARTTVPIRFDPSGSVFVVFRTPAPPGDHLARVRTPSDIAAPPPPVIEITKAMYEAVDGAGGSDVTAKVAAMVKSGETSIPATNQLFGDPTYMHYKRLRVEYTIDGKALTRSASENTTLDLIEAGPEIAAACSIAVTPDGVRMLAFQGGTYEFTSAKGKTSRIEVPEISAPVDLPGPWNVVFQPNRGAPTSVRFGKLMSWTDHLDAGVRYFSGTAEYEKEIDIPSGLLASGASLFLDLGDVQCIAEVTLNGKALGVWWKPPFAADITAIAKPGKNDLRVRVTNLWVNRLIGDEQHKDDCEWNGKPLKEWPEWFAKGTARPVPERIAFTTWKHYTKESPLLASGLIGPVTLRPAKQVPIEVGK